MSFYPVLGCFLGLSLLLADAAPAPPRPYAFAFINRTCLWCGRDLAPGQPYFDTDRCGLRFADQMAVRGHRLHVEEIVTFGSTEPVPWAGLSPAP